MLVPVPLYRWRLWQRRFNQSAFLAQEIAKLTAKPWRTDVLFRRRRTKSQVGLDPCGAAQECEGSLRGGAESGRRDRWQDGTAGRRCPHHRSDGRGLRAGAESGGSRAGQRCSALHLFKHRRSYIFDGIMTTQPQYHHLYHAVVSVLPCRQGVAEEEGCRFRGDRRAGSRRLRQQMMLKSHGRHTVPQIFIGEPPCRRFRRSFTSSTGAAGSIRCCSRREISRRR